MFIIVQPGTAISHLERSEMGCVDFPIWIGIVTAMIVLSLIIGATVINRKWEAIKFLCFNRFNVLINDDEPENVEVLEYDAFIIYR